MFNLKQKMGWSLVLSSSLLAFSPAHADLSTGLMAHYSFDDCSAKDSSSNANNGTVTSNLQCTDGKMNKGLLFDGSSYITYRVRLR